MTSSSVVAVASATEIGEWVERNAAEELRQRAETIAAIERAAADAGDLGKDMYAGDSSWPGRSGTREVGSNIWQQVTKSSVETKASLASSAEAPRSRSRGRVVLLLAVGLCVTTLALALVLFSRTHASAQVTRTTTDKVVVAPKVDDVPTANVEDLPQAPPTDTILELEPEASKPVAAPPPRAKGSTPRPPTKSSSHSEDNCNPPYTADSNGHIHFKPSCL
jgi:hypothetical protein